MADWQPVPRLCKLQPFVGTTSSQTAERPSTRVACSSPYLVVNVNLDRSFAQILPPAHLQDTVLV
jgi:hypothetical protein